MTQTLCTKVCYTLFSSNSSLCLSSLSLHKWEQYFVILGNQSGTFNRKYELKQTAVEQAELFSEYFCSEAAKVRGRSGKGRRRTAQVASAVPGWARGVLALWPAGWTCSTSGRHKAAAGPGQQLSRDSFLADTAPAPSLVVPAEGRRLAGPLLGSPEEGSPSGTRAGMQMQPGATSSPCCPFLLPLECSSVWKFLETNL